MWSFRDRQMFDCRAGRQQGAQRSDGVDPLRSIKAGRSPILLTEHNGQMDEFASRRTGVVKRLVVLKGGMGAKQRRAIAEQLTTIPDGEERVLLATPHSALALN
jgi:hypothetical protein